MNKKKCTKCGRELPLTEFYKQKNAKCGRQAECKNCVNSRQKLEFRDPNKKRRHLHLLSSHRHSHPELTHDLSREKFDELCKAKHCPICGCELVDFKNHRQCRSFDRILNDVGLIDNNTWVICNSCNIRKGAFNGQQLLHLAMSIIKKEKEVNENVQK